MWVKTIASTVLRGFSESRRRVLSDWRIWVILRRLAHAEQAPPPDEKKAIAVRSELVRRGDLVPAEGVSEVYVVDIPYANLLEVSEEQIIQEANPNAVFAYLTAMAYHGLTDLIPREVYAITLVGSGDGSRLPLGTMPEDWSDGIPFPAMKQPKTVRGVPVRWTQVTEGPAFGVVVGYSFGLPVYVTDAERTLLDALRSPDKSGGIAKVLQAWRSAEGIDVGTLVRYTDRYDNKVLRQRVGYLLEALGKTHPRLEEWRHDLQRGGSVKLVANLPYSDKYAAGWNLSLNVPPSLLAVLGAG